MQKMTLSQKQLHPKQKFSSGEPRWKLFFALMFGLIIPGLPQILSRKKHHLPASLLFLFGVGALISLLISVFISGGQIQVVDLTYAIAVPNLPPYPGDFIISSEDSDKLIPISPPEEILIIQPYFRELRRAFMFLYLFCALVSCGDIWRGRHRSYESSPSSSGKSKHIHS